jgi:hypothetical protein
VTSSTTPQARAVRLLAERLWKDYDSQYSANHLTWVDFEGEARGHLKALADAGLLSSGTQEEDQYGSLRSTPPALGEGERKAPRLRRSGSPWTVRVHTWDGDVQTPSHTISNREVWADSEHHRGHLFPAAEFDELVVGRWLHVEQMDNATWWMNIGGVTVHVSADREGRPTWVRVSGPHDYDEPREGCAYEVDWTPLPEAIGEAAKEKP